MKAIRIATHTPLLGFNQQCMAGRSNSLTSHFSPRALASLRSANVSAASTPSVPGYINAAVTSGASTLRKRAPACLRRSVPRWKLLCPPNRLVDCSSELPVTQYQSGWWVNDSVGWLSGHGGASGLLSRSQRWSETGRADKPDGVKSSRVSPLTDYLQSPSLIRNCTFLTHQLIRRLLEGPDNILCNL